MRRILMLSVLATALGVMQPARAQLAHSLPEDHSPRGALWRSAAVPGWGQVYNRQHVKVPFVYAALGALVVSTVRNQRDYTLYRDAFQYKAFQELVDAGQLESNPNADLLPAYNTLVAEFGPISSRPIETRRNNFRRNRDLSAIGIGFVYGLAMLDAYVSAHLLDFDVEEDLSIRLKVSPVGMGPAVGFRF